MEGGCVRRLLQLCGQFDQQTTVAAATSAGLGVVGAGAALERGSGWRERHGVCALRALCCLVEVSLSFNAVAFRCSSPRTCPPRYQALAAGFRHCAAATSRDGLADAVASAAGLVLVASLSLAYR